MEVIKFIQSFANPLLDNLFLGITILGEEYLAIVILLIFFWCKDKKVGYKLGFALSFSFLINGSIKDVIKSPRPIGREGIRSLRVKTATGYSFPSGHTQNTATLWTSLILNFKKVWVSILGVAFIILVGLSRLYLGVHWPKDVIGGVVFAVISVFISNYLFETMEKNNDKRIAFILSILAILGMCIFKSSDYAKAVGIFIGFSVGYFVEDKYIKFQIQKDLKKNIIRFILGLIILIAIKVVMKIILPTMRVTDVIRYGVIGLWCTVGAPYVFKKMEL